MENGTLDGITLVFDLDGTLVDTAPDLLRALNHVLTGVGYPPTELEEIHAFIGHGARRMIGEAMAAAGKPGSEAQIDALFDPFLEHYGRNVAIDSRPYPGVLDVLELGLSAGARLAVCTNKSETLSRQLLAELGMERFFAAIAGRDTFPVCKPDPAHLTGAVQMAGGDAARAIMIGDSATDIETARAAGVPVIAVSFGYTEVPASELGADVVIDHYGDMSGALAHLLG